MHYKTCVTIALLQILLMYITYKIIIKKKRHIVHVISKDEK